MKLMKWMLWMMAVMLLAALSPVRAMEVLSDETMRQVKGAGKEYGKECGIGQCNDAVEKLCFFDTVNKCCRRETKNSFAWCFPIQTTPPNTVAANSDLWCRKIPPMSASCRTVIMYERSTNCASIVPAGQQTGCDGPSTSVHTGADKPIDCEDGADPEVKPPGDGGPEVI